MQPAFVELIEHSICNVSISLPRRAGISGQPEYTVSATSFDSVSRDPLRVPFAYPLHQLAGARLPWALDHYGYTAMLSWRSKESITDQP